MKLLAPTVAATLLAVLLLGAGPGGSVAAQTGGSISGWVFLDLNENGQHEPSEPGLEGWYVTLARITGPDQSEPLEPVRTAGNGSYRFSNVEPGEYLVYGPHDAIQESPQLAPGSELEVRVTLEAGQRLEEVNFRVAFPEATRAPSPSGGSAPAQGGGSIAGWVFYDLNGNRQHEPEEPGLEGWYLTLDRVTAPDFSEPVDMDMASTNWNGSYRFSDVEPGIYLVNLGPLPPQGPQPEPGTELNARLILEAGQSFEEVNFRIALPEATPTPPPASGGMIEGYVFIDADGDGVMDDGEYPLVGLSLTITGQGAWVETGADGRYSFAGLPAGTYRVGLSLMDAPTGIWLAVSPAPDLRTGIEREVELAAGETETNVNFAVRRLEGTGIIAGTVFEDSNRNGVRDTGETGVAKPYVRLEGVDFVIRDPSGPNLAEVTSGGRYQFTGLPAGSYRVYGTAPRLGLAPYTGGPEGSIALAEGEMRDGVDFGFARLQPGSISGRVVNDLDGDGRLEGGEPGLGGWGLCLGRSSTDVIDCGMTRTGSDGTYTVDNLGPGEYGLRLETALRGAQGQPPGWVVTVPDTPWRNVTLEEAQDVVGVDFGVHRDESTLLSVGPLDPTSGDRGLQPWQIAAAISCALALTGIVAAVATARYRKIRRAA